jgi:hypothetical protein
MDTIKTIKPAVQQHGRYIASLSPKTAQRTINALLADDYGVDVQVKVEGRWIVVVHGSN